MEEQLEKVPEKGSSEGGSLYEEESTALSLLKTLSSVFVVLFLFLSMYLFRDYVHALLIWAEKEPPSIVLFIVTLLFTLVSLPIAWGYIVINMAAGYLFGVLYGLLVTVFCATIGIVVAHVLIKIFLSGYVRRLLNSSEYSRALLAVISGPQAFKLVALCRLTPVPFGLQNALFAVVNLPVTKYIGCSVVGLLPSQAINAYIGSTLRSMEEVLSNEETMRTGWMLLGAQLALSLLVGILIVQRAKLELNAAISSQQIESA